MSRASEAVARVVAAALDRVDARIWQRIQAARDAWQRQGGDEDERQ